MNSYCFIFEIFIISYIYTYFLKKILKNISKKNNIFAYKYRIRVYSFKSQISQKKKTIGIGCE